MRLSTRDLFAILTFVAVLSWCAGKVGFDNPQFWMAAVVSLTLAAFFILGSGYRDGRTAALLAVIFFGGVCSLFFGSIASFFSSLLLVLATLVAAAVQIRSTRVRCSVAMVCVGAAFVLATSYGNADFNRIAELRELFPIESLENRLVYEGEQPSTEATIRMTPAMNAQLTEDEQIFLQRGWRTIHLRQIHDREYEQFVRASGFGISRLGPPSRGRLEMPPLRDIAFAGAAPDDERDRWLNWHAGNNVDADSSVEKMHDASRIDFLDPEGFGNIIAPRTKVVRFIPHAFHRHPVEDAQERPKWSIDRIELVSLLKFDGPRVYVLDHLPRMDQLSSDTAPTRELNEFEASALSQLRSAEDLVVQHGGSNYLMLGSLRAAKQCLDCHNVQRGELLGAFSYRLTLAEDDRALESELAAKEQAPTERPDSTLRSK